MDEVRVLHLGGGANPTRQLLTSNTVVEERNIDVDPGAKSAITVPWDLTLCPWPKDKVGRDWDEVHAYEVLEHLAPQYNIDLFFAIFREIHKCLKPGGLLLASTPDYRSPWAWGDPDHKRVINHCTITFLIKEQYEKGLRPVYKHMVDGYFWKLNHSNYESERYWFVLEKI